jgi:hypothetical protein
MIVNETEGWGNPGSCIYLFPGAIFTRDETVVIDIDTIVLL